MPPPSSFQHLPTPLSVSRPHILSLCFASLSYSCSIFYLLSSLSFDVLLGGVDRVCVCNEGWPATIPPPPHTLRRPRGGMWATEGGGSCSGSISEPDEALQLHRNKDAAITDAKCSHSTAAFRGTSAAAWIQNDAPSANGWWKEQTPSFLHRQVFSWRESWRASDARHRANENERKKTVRITRWNDISWKNPKEAKLLVDNM